MRFFVSRRYLQHQTIERMGNRYFKLMPQWVQEAPFTNKAIVIAPSSQDAEDVSRRVRLIEAEELHKFVFQGNIQDGYLDFFGQLIKKTVHSDSFLNQLFLVHARTIMVDGVSNQDVIDVLFRHLAWYFINKNGLNRWNPKRYRFCKQIVEDLSCISSVQGTLM